MIHVIRFIAFVFLQVFILNQMELGFGIQIMLYPLFILLLPVELGIIPLMLIAFVTGLVIDIFSNTYGLHASALVLVAYSRPMIFKLFAPRDGYDPLIETNLFNLGRSWYMKTFGILLLIHHLWFFLIEMFKFSELLFILQKTLLSLPISFALSILVHFLFMKKVKDEVR